MPSSSLNVVVQHLRAAAGRDGAGPTDGELLTHFLSRRDEDALAALVERHAPMVWGVCRRVLRNPHDAEDAFQATFLILVQKAATVVPREMVANWLYGVAQQTAVRLRATAAKRGWREVQMNEMPEPAEAEARDEELLSRLDDELSRLPERFRALILLCDLEGHTRKEVARQLGCPEGTVASGLARARALLAKRLTRRGLAVSGGSLAATLTNSVASADVPPTVVTSAINVATLFAAGKAAGVISGPVATLTQGVLKTMFLKKIVTTAVAVLALGVAVVTCGSLAVGQSGGKPAVAKGDQAPVAEKPVNPDAKQPKQKKVEEEAFTAWGEEQPGGVQIGLGYLPGEKRAYRTGESVTFVVRAKSVGNQAVNLEYAREPWLNFPPSIVDGDGKKYAVPKVITNLETVPSQVTLKAGKETELYRMTLELRPAGEADDKQVMKVFGTGKFQIQEAVGLVGKAWVGNARAAAIDRTLPSGKLELEVTDKPPVVEQKREKEAFTAWGKEVGGVQAGLGYRLGEKRTYHTGETVRVVLRVRNVGKEEVKFSYCHEELHGRPPVVTDEGDKPVPLEGVQLLGWAKRIEVTLAPGKEVDLGEASLVLRSAGEKGKETPVWKLFGTGKFRLQCEKAGGYIQDEKLGPDPILSKLATGTLELDVKEPEKDGTTAWGKEVNGVQVGIHLGKPRVYRVGETVTLTIRLRNNGKDDVPFRDNAEYFRKNPPSITDADGKAVAVQPMSIWGYIRLRSIAPGKEIDLIQLELALRPAADREKRAAWTLYGTGKFQIQYPVADVVGEVRLGSPGMTLTTGKVELEVTDTLPGDEKKPLTPEEVTRMKEGSKLTVEFKVESVTKAVLIKSEAKKEWWATGHGPDDQCLRPEHPKDKGQARFLSILTPDAIGQLNKAGIRDIEKHFGGKTVRVTGPIVKQDYRGRGTPVEVEIVVNDLSQLEVVN